MTVTVQTEPDAATRGDPPTSARVCRDFLETDEPVRVNSHFTGSQYQMKRFTSISTIYIHLHSITLSFDSL